MSKVCFLIISVMISSQAFAKVVTFNCLTQEGFEGGNQRTINFALDMTNLKHVLIVGQGFDVAPSSEILGALINYDNLSISVKSDRMEIVADSIGMYVAQISLYKNKDYKVGFLKTWGESNVERYSTVTCQNDF